MESILRFLNASAGSFVEGYRTMEARGAGILRRYSWMGQRLAALDRGPRGIGRRSAGPGQANKFACGRNQCLLNMVDTGRGYRRGPRRCAKTPKRAIRALP